MEYYLDLDDAARGHPKAEDEAYGYTIFRYLRVLAEIQTKCLSSLQDCYDLDQEYICDLITVVTGLTNSELNQYVAEQELTFCDQLTEDVWNII